VADHIAKQDIVITTALIPGRAAPKLVSAAMVASMKPGSVLVDLAVERGGNVEGAVAGQVTTKDGVKIVGHMNTAGRIAASASQLYARNLFAFLETLIDKETKQVVINLEDELVKATALTHQGAIVHPAFANVAVVAEKAEPVAKTEAAAKPAAKKAPVKKAAPKKPVTAKETAKPAAKTTVRKKAATEAGNKGDEA
jgi:NAD(P) transhydrogenase subunit alpha